MSHYTHAHTHMTGKHSYFTPSFHDCIKLLRTQICLNIQVWTIYDLLYNYLASNFCPGSVMHKIITHSLFTSPFWDTSVVTYQIFIMQLNLHFMLNMSALPMPSQFNVAFLYCILPSGKSLTHSGVIKSSDPFQACSLFTLTCLQIL